VKTGRKPAKLNESEILAEYPALSIHALAVWQKCGIIRIREVLVRCGRMLRSKGRPPKKSSLSLK